MYLKKIQEENPSKFPTELWRKLSFVHTIICTTYWQQDPKTAGDFPTSQRLIHLPFYSTEKCWANPFSSLAPII